MFSKILLAAILVACAPAAYARRSHRGDVVGFATSNCVSFSCYSKHSAGTWRHPLTEPTGRGRRVRSYSYPGG